MKKLFKPLLFAILTFAIWPAYASTKSAPEPMDIGVVPYMSARVLIASYEPMRNFLEQELGRPVRIYTANGFKPFLLHAQKGDYDLVISAAHFARILQTQNHYLPLVRYSSGGRGLVMTKLNSPLKTPQDLRGRVIAVPDQLSLASIVCMTSLRESGLRTGKDFTLLEVPSFASAILSVQKDEAMAAVSAPGALVQMPGEMRESVRPVLDTGDYINLVFLANPHLGKKYAERLNLSLQKFGNETDAGKQFLSSTGFGTIIPATITDMNTLDRYMPETKRLLSETP